MRFSCDQAALWKSQSTHLYLRPSVCRIFLTMLLSSLYHEIFNYFHWLKWCPCKSQGQKSKLKVTDVKTYFVPIWEFPVRNSSFNWPMATEWCRKIEVVKKRCPIVFQGHASYFKVKLTQIERFWTGTPIWIHRWLRNDTHSLEWFKTVSHCFSGSSAKFLSHTGRKSMMTPNWFLCDKYDELRHTRNCAQRVNETQSEEWKLKKNNVK